MHHALQSTWDALAQHHTLESIATSSRDDIGAFWASGERTAEFLQSVLPHRIDANQTVLDFGVGIGRVAFPIAAHCRSLIGIDVSTVMLDKFRAEIASRTIVNITTAHIDESWDETPVDVIYSVLTFQHMPDDEVIRILPRLANAMTHHGYLQFDTRRNHIPVATLLPDFLLPWTMRTGMRRFSRKSETVRSWIINAGMTILSESNPDSALHGFVVQPARHT